MIEPLAKQPSLASYKTLFLTYLGPQWRKATLMSVLLLTGIVLQLVNPLILRYFVDTFTAGGSHAALTLAGLLFIVVALIIQGVSVLATYYSENVAWTATNQLRTDLVAHCLTLDMAFHKAHTPGELIERIDGDVDTLSNFFSQAVIHLFGNSVLILGVLIFFFLADWRIGLVMSAFAIFALIMLSLYPQLRRSNLGSLSSTGRRVLWFSGRAARGNRRYASERCQRLCHVAFLPLFATLVSDQS